MIRRQDFRIFAGILGKTNKIVEQIQESAFCKHALYQRGKICIPCFFVISVNGLPFHKTIEGGRDGACFCPGLITDDTKGIVDKKAFYGFLIVLNLPVCILYGDPIRFRRF